MNPQNGKGSAPRKNADDKKFKENWSKIFEKKFKKDEKKT